MMYDLPKSVEVCGIEYKIRSDYRAILDICAALSDGELESRDKAEAVLHIFYPDFADMPRERYEFALKQCFLFINCGGEEENRKAPKLMDWNQDFKYIVAPINRVVGMEIRAVDMHWWTFVSAYYEIGECLFSQIVSIRSKLARGKPLDKTEREWYRNNRMLVDFKTQYTEQENEILKQLTGK